MLKEKNDPFEDALNAKLRAFEAEPPLNAWQNIRKNVQADDGYNGFDDFLSKNKFYFIISSIIVTSAAIVLFLLSSETKFIKKVNDSTVYSENSSTTISAPQAENAEEVLVKHEPPVEKNPEFSEKTVVQKTSERKNKKSTLNKPVKSKSVDSAAMMVPMNLNETSLHNIDNESKQELEIKKDSLIAEVEHKSFYEKKLKDSTLKANKLFK